MTTVELAQGTKILIDGVETTLEAIAEQGNLRYEWIPHPTTAVAGEDEENVIVGQSASAENEGVVVADGQEIQIIQGQVVDDETDRLTDSNSSEKMTALDEEEAECVYYSQESGVPINFPIKGRILARLQGRGFEYFMTKNEIVIGRDSSKGTVDINMGHSNFISRNHITIVHDDDEFYLTCGGKNGVFVDDFFQKINAPRIKIPKSCTLRFPSTQIVIAFDAAECFIDKYSTTNPKTLGKFGTYVTPPADKQLTALRVQIPPNGKQDVKKAQFFSPCPSPTGTMSAVNSCPTSPNGAGNAPVFVRKALQTNPARYISTPQAVGAKDTRIPITEDDTKPPYSYAQLIVQAISSTPQKQMTLSGIYAYISRNYSYYRANDKGWQNSIRHNLSLNRYFIKVARSQEEPGKGCFWAIDSVSEPKLVAQAFRRRNKRGVPYFRGTPSSTAGLMTQSCPVSPTSRPINITIVTPDLLSAQAAAANVKSEVAASSANQHITVQSLASTANSNNNNIVTIATSSSLAEAITMQQSRVSHVIDMSSVRAIQSAPGSPLSGYKMLSPVGAQQASLLTAKMLPKGATMIGGAKSSGITLLQPITALNTLASAAGGQTQRSVVTLPSLSTLPTSSQSQLQSHQLLHAGTLIAPVQTVMSNVVSMSQPITTAADNTSLSATAEYTIEVDALPATTQPRVQAVPINQQPIRLIQIKRPADDSDSTQPSPAKVPRTTDS